MGKGGNTTGGGGGALTFRALCRALGGIGVWAVWAEAEGRINRSPKEIDTNHLPVRDIRNPHPRAPVAALPVTRALPDSSTAYRTSGGVISCVFRAPGFLTDRTSAGGWPGLSQSFEIPRVARPSFAWAGTLTEPIGAYLPVRARAWVRSSETS